MCCFIVCFTFVSIFSFFDCYPSRSNDEKKIKFPIIPIINEYDNPKETKVDISTYENREWILALGEKYRISFNVTRFLNNIFQQTARHNVKINKFTQWFRQCLVISKEYIDALTRNEQERMYNIALYTIVATNTFDLLGVQFSDGKLPELVQRFIQDKKYLLYHFLLKNDVGQYIDPYKRSKGSIKTLILQNCNLKELPENFWDLFYSVLHLDLSHNQLTTLPDFTENFKNKFRIASYIQCPLITMNLSNNCFTEFPLHFAEKNYFFPFLKVLNLANNNILNLQIPCVRDSKILPNALLDLDVHNNPLKKYRKNFARLFQATFPQLLPSSPDTREKNIVPIRFGKVSINHQSFLHFMLKTLQETKKIHSIQLMDMSNMMVNAKTLQSLIACVPKINMLRFGAFTKRAWKRWSKGSGKKITKYVKNISFTDISKITGNGTFSTYSAQKIRIENVLGNLVEPPSISLNRKLQKIVVSDIAINKEIIKRMKDLPLIYEVSLRRCGITNELFKKIVQNLFKTPTDCRITKLTVIENPQLTQVNIKALPPSVHYLDISKNAITDLTIKQPIKKVTVPGIPGVSRKKKYTSLHRLNVSNNLLSDDTIIKRILQQFKNLSYVNIANNFFNFDTLLTLDNQPSVTIRGKVFGKKRIYTIILHQENGQHHISLYDGKPLMGQNPFKPKYHGTIYAADQKEQM